MLNQRRAQKEDNEPVAMMHILNVSLVRSAAKAMPSFPSKFYANGCWL